MKQQFKNVNDSMNRLILKNNWCKLCFLQLIMLTISVNNKRGCYDNQLNLKLLYV